MKTIKFLTLITVLFGFTLSCSDEFTDNPPEDQLTVDNFFTTDDQIFSSGSALYGFPWFYFAGEKAMISIGDLYSGLAVGSYQDLQQFEQFSVTSNNQFLSEGWNSLYNVVAASNSLLFNLDTKVSSGVSTDLVNNVKGEAYFMRAVAYFYLVRGWGDVPIIHSMDQYNSSSIVFKNPVADVYRFIIQDLTTANQLLPSQWSSAEGRVIKSTTDAFLAKVYLTMGDYANAKLYAEKVMNSGDYSLLDNYGDLFRPQNNNNSESIFALQWIGCSDWGYGSTIQAYVAANSRLTGFGDGWGTFQPSIHLINSYEDNDLRRQETIMEPGAFYPELVTSEGGYRVPEDGLTSTIAGFRKYVVGPPGDTEVETCFMRTGLNTYILRYADILLIHAESILAGNASTSDGAALASFNAVRERAGLDPKTEITFSDIFQERKVELALESDHWFDLARIDRAEAKSIIEDQERGTYANRNVDELNSQKVTASDADFLLPIPESELLSNPNMSGDPVPFEF